MRVLWIHLRLMAMLAWETLRHPLTNTTVRYSYKTRRFTVEYEEPT